MVYLLKILKMGIFHGYVIVYQRVSDRKIQTAAMIAAWEFPKVWKQPCRRHLDVVSSE